MYKYINDERVLMTDAEVAEYMAVQPTAADIFAAKLKTAETSVQSHINSVVVSRGYDNENSIAKYLVIGNPFYTECSAISLWIGAVWVYVYQVQANIQAGTRTEPTIEQLIAELPVLL